MHFRVVIMDMLIYLEILGCRLYLSISLALCRKLWLFLRNFCISVKAKNINLFEKKKKQRDAHLSQNSGVLSLIIILFINFYLQHKCFTTIHKHYSIDDWRAAFEEDRESLQFVAASSGTSNADWERLQQILGLFSEVRHQESVNSNRVRGEE